MQWCGPAAGRQARRSELNGSAFAHAAASGAPLLGLVVEPLHERVHERHVRHLRADGRLERALEPREAHAQLAVGAVSQEAEARGVAPRHQALEVFGAEHEARALLRADGRLRVAAQLERRLQLACAQCGPLTHMCCTQTADRLWPNATHSHDVFAASLLVHSVHYACTECGSPCEPEAGRVRQIKVIVRLSSRLFSVYSGGDPSAPMLSAECSCRAVSTDDVGRVDDGKVDGPLGDERLEAGRVAGARRLAHLLLDALVFGALTHTLLEVAHEELLARAALGAAARAVRRGRLLVCAAQVLRDDLGAPVDGRLLLFRADGLHGAELAQPQLRVLTLVHRGLHHILELPARQEHEARERLACAQHTMHALKWPKLTRPLTFTVFCWPLFCAPASVC